MSSILILLTSVVLRVAGAVPWSKDSPVLMVPGGHLNCLYVMTKGLLSMHDEAPVKPPPLFVAISPSPDSKEQFFYFSEGMQFLDFDKVTVGARKSPYPRRRGGAASRTMELVMDKMISAIGKPPAPAAPATAEYVPAPLGALYKFRSGQTVFQAIQIEDIGVPLITLFDADFLELFLKMETAASGMEGRAPSATLTKALVQFIKAEARVDEIGRWATVSCSMVEELWMFTVIVFDKLDRRSTRVRPPAMLEFVSDELVEGSGALPRTFQLVMHDEAPVPATCIDHLLSRLRASEAGPVPFVFADGIRGFLFQKYVFIKFVGSSTSIDESLTKEDVALLHRFLGEVAGVGAVVAGVALYVPSSAATFDDAKSFFDTGLDFEGSGLFKGLAALMSRVAAIPRALLLEGTASVSLYHVKPNGNDPSKLSHFSSLHPPPVDPLTGAADDYRFLNVLKMSVLDAVLKSKGSEGAWLTLNLGSRAPRAPTPEPPMTVERWEHDCLRSVKSKIIAMTCEADKKEVVSAFWRGLAMAAVRGARENKEPSYHMTATVKPTAGLGRHTYVVTLFSRYVVFSPKAVPPANFYRTLGEHVIPSFMDHKLGQQGYGIRVPLTLASDFNELVVATFRSLFTGFVITPSYGAYVYTNCNGKTEVFLSDLRVDPAFAIQKTVNTCGYDTKLYQIAMTVADHMIDRKCGEGSYVVVVFKR